MSIFGLCPDDPVLQTVRDVFNANPVRVPEERIKPLSIVAQRGDRTAFRDKLSNVLTPGPPLSLTPDESKMAAVSGKRSRSVNIDLGLEILAQFLQGFGVAAPGIKAGLGGATAVSFQFNKVQRLFIDPGVLGNELRGRRVDRSNAAASIYFGDSPWAMLVIDSTIQSSEFTLSVEQSQSGNLQVDIGAIQQIVGNVNAAVRVQAVDQRTITFQGPQFLTFAFSCLRVYLDDDGTITGVPPADLGASLRAEGVHVALPRVMLSPKPGLLEWDSVDD